MTIYSIDNCIKCKMLKEKLKNSDVEFIEINIDHDNAAKAFIVSKGLSSMPVIFHNRILTNGDDALKMDVEKLKK